MQFLPCAMFCQNSSRFLACGNCPAKPITAMGCGELTICGACVLLNREVVRLRREVSFCPANFIAIPGFDDGTMVFAETVGIAAVGGTHGADSAPFFSASSLT